MPGTFPPVTGYRGGGLHGLAPGEWTNDSSMALALVVTGIPFYLMWKGRRSD